MTVDPPDTEASGAVISSAKYAALTGSLADMSAALGQ